MTPQEKRIQTMIAKHGSYEAYREHMRELGSKGGKKQHSGLRGFALDPERARKLGKKGGMKRWHK